MESKKEYFKRETKQCRYDKKLILDIVKLVEDGMSRKEANQKFELGASTLDGWMRDYGSKAYHERKRKNLSSLEKRKIIAEVNQGRLTVREAQVKYNMKSVKTIHNILYQWRQENLNFYPSTELGMAKPKRKYLSNTTSAQPLQRAFEEAQLKIEALNTMIDVAEEQLKIDIRKKFGIKQ
jgi:transposase